MDLKDKLVLVTGGGSGIGLGIALALAGEGCRVVITGRDEAKLLRAASQFTAQPPIVVRACDVSDRGVVCGLVDWVVEELGTPDILVNSAGINIAKRAVSELDPVDWDRVLAINATGAFNCIHALLPAMRRRHSGLIVNISSIAGKRVSTLGGLAYCASKFAMTALGTEVGLEERANGIHVTNIYPGEVATPILERRPVPVPPERVAKMLQPDDIAALVVTIAKLPPRALVAEVVVTPLYQHYA